MKAFLRFFFRLLYHQFAFTYDLVAATVSLGRWNDWVLSAVPFLKGPRILELGHGPGHLQQALRGRQWQVFGIDESHQMGQLARRNLLKRRRKPAQVTTSLDYTQVNLTRGISQHLPFAPGSFETLVATFPSEYIFDLRTLAEARRVLTNDGRIVIVPGATILGRGVLDRAMAFVFRVTGETPPDLPQVLQQKAREPFAKAGFNVQIHEISVRASLVFVIVASKTPA